MHNLKPVIFAAAILASTLLSARAWATTSFTFAGTNSATASFTLSGNDLTVVLTNTTRGGTLSDAGVLTGLTWQAPGFDNITLKLLSTTASSLTPSGGNNISGTWTNTLSSSHGSDAYGIATSGENGLFDAGTIHKSAPGSAQYGIVANGTNINLDGMKNHHPFAENSVTFVFSGASGLDLSQLTDLKAYFGTNGCGVGGTAAVPEPSSLFLVVGAMLGWALFFRRKQEVGAVSARNFH